MAASLTLLQITSVDLMHPQSKALPRTRGLQCQLFTNRTGPTDLTMSAYAGILLKKSFEGDERNFPGPLMRFARRDEEGPHRFSEKRPRSFVSALQSIATTKSFKHQRLRDF